MITYIFFIINTFLFTWYTDKLLNNKMTDGYWHIPQLLMLIGFFLMPIAVAKYKVQYLIRVALFGCMFPFLFNTGLNLYRGLPYNHLGKYDFLSFAQTVALFAFAIFATVGYEMYERTKQQLNNLTIKQ